MAKGKELLKELVDKALNVFEQYDNDTSVEAFDVTSLKEIETKLKNTPEYQESFVMDIKEDVLAKLSSLLDGDNNEFKSSISAIKGIIDLNINKGLDFTLKENQKKDLDTLKELITKYIVNYETTIGSKRTYNNKLKLKYTILRNKLENKKMLESEDYETAEELVIAFCETDKDTALDEIMTYLNEFNIPLLVLKDKQKIEITLEETDEKQFDPFDHQETSVIERPRNNKSLKLAEKMQKLKEIISYLGFNFDLLDGTLKTKLISIKDVYETEKFAHYLKDKKNISLYTNSINALVVLLTESNETTFNKIFEVISGLYNNDETLLKKIFRNGVNIFTIKGSKAFNANRKIIEEYKLDLRTSIIEHPTFFSSDNKKIVECLEKTKAKGIRNEELLRKCMSLIPQDASRIEENIAILENYGFNIEELQTYSILGGFNLAQKLDEFIELGLNEYIHANPSRAGIVYQSLVIKKIYYALKNNLPIWRSANCEQKLLNHDVLNKDGYSTTETLESIPSDKSNEDYNIIINEGSNIITEEEIKDLLVMHLILERVESGHRLALYSDNNLNSVRQKTEFRFGNKVISRLKTYRAFRELINKGVDEEEALLYSLTYNSILEDHEFEEIKQSIKGNKVGEKSI